jgi:hypothetical protein
VRHLSPPSPELQSRIERARGYLRQEAWFCANLRWKMERRLKFPLGQEVAAGFVVPDLEQLPPPRHEEIARRAYAIYQARGGGNGRALRWRCNLCGSGRDLWN